MPYSQPSDVGRNYNVVVHLSVNRPEDEYLPELLRHRLAWDSYAGHMYVRSVEVLSGHAPFPEGMATEAIATLTVPETVTPDDSFRSALQKIADADLKRCSAGWLQQIAVEALQRHEKASGPQEGGGAEKAP